ncbi:MAG: hypothetical protein JKX73_01960 [Flavobacteriales bacterium]|nr:hypothetical protein [Flavobacteriales bacterium]
MKSLDLKKLIPHGVAVALFLAVTVLFFLPLMQGKTLTPHDVGTWKGASKEIVDYRAKNDSEPLWTNSMFSGMPAYQISTVYTSNAFTYIIQALNSALRPGNYLFLYLIGFYILLLAFKVDPWLAIAGALAFGFSSYFLIILEAGHNTKASAIAFMAPIVAGVILSFRGRHLLGGAMMAFFLALELKSNHLQITYYLLFILLIFGFFELVTAVKEKQLPPFFKSLGVLVIAAILAVGSNITSIWVTYDYGKYTTRGVSELTFDKENKTTGLDKSYITGWSYGVAETMTLLIPNYMGGPSQGELGTDSETYKFFKSAGVPNAKQIIKQLPLYWGTQPGQSGPVYVGAIVCFLFVLGLFMIKGNIKWWLLSATILGITLSWGKNFMPLTDFFVDYFPGYDKFRSVSMTLVIAEFTMPLLGFLALNKLFNDEGDELGSILKSLKYSLFIVGGIALVYTLLPSLFNDFVGVNDAQLESSGYPIGAIQEDRENMLRSDAFRSLIFIILSAGVLWMFVKKKLSKQYAFAALIGLVLVDLWGVNKRYLNESDFITEKKASIPYQLSQANLTILGQEMQLNPDIQNTAIEYTRELEAAKKDNPRRLRAVTQEEQLDIQFKSMNEHTNFRVMNVTVSTFNDVSTSYYHKSIGGYHGAKLKRYQELIEFQISRNNMEVLNMLNTKYFIVKGQDGQPGAQTNPGALGNAWFVSQLKVVANPDSEITALSSFNPRVEAVVNQKYTAEIAEHSSLTFDSTASITMTSYAPNHLVYQSKTATKQLAVFSEIYYDDGWNAYLDGEPVSHFGVNYVLRAMTIPVGEHLVEFKFEPNTYATGEKISLAFSLLLFLLIASAGYTEFKALQSEEE